MKSSASEVRFLLVPLTREFRAPRREHSSSERSERLRTPAQGSLGDRGGCWFATPGRDPGVSRDSPVRSRSITLLLVGTTARQPRTLPCSLRELRSPQPASGLPPDNRGSLACSLRELRSPRPLLSESSNWLGQRVLAPQMGVQVPLPILPTPFDRASSDRTHFYAVAAGAVMRFQTSSCKVQSFVAAPSSSGSGPAWQGVRFGSGRSGVRISPPRQNRISNSIGRRLGFYPRGSGFESQGMHVSTGPSRAGSSGAATGS